MYAATRQCGLWGAAVEPEEEEIALLNGERTRFRRRGVRESPTEQREDAWDSILPRDSRAAHHAETWETSVSGADKTASRAVAHVVISIDRPDSCMSS